MRHTDVKRLWILLVLAAALSLTPALPTAHAQSGIVTLSATAGFGGRFRDNMWTPVTVRLENSGAPFSGTLTLRPERSRGLTNPVSTPVELAGDAAQTFTLYVSLRSFTELLRVELLTADGLIAAEAEIGVSVVLPRERLYLRASGSLTGSVDLSSAASSGQLVTQANVSAADLPDRAIGLEAADIIVFQDTDTDLLTPAQRSALAGWVAGGGHLIVTGGAPYAVTAAGLADLLPFQPTGSTTAIDFSALESVAGAGYGLLDDSAASVIATGTPTDGAQVIASDSDGNALIVRRETGLGLVDYLTFDPVSAPFSDWVGLPGLWRSLAVSRAPRPSWAAGFINIGPGYTSLEILPGVTVLPEATAMVGFLALYIVLIGPLNYFLLARLGRRELGWITIPALIGLFTVVAWVTGFNLRGEEVVLSRLTVVESWPDAPEARQRQLIGMLAPRRADYDLALDDGRALRPLLRADTGFTTSAANTVQVVQDTTFRADDFPVDASFMAGFVTEAYTPQPALSGELTVLEQSFEETWRGSVKNDLTIPLSSPMLLSRSGVYRLGDALEPGELRLIDAQVPLAPGLSRRTPASPLMYASGYAIPTEARYTVRGRVDGVGPETTVREVIGDEFFDNGLYYGLTGGYIDPNLSQADARRQTFLSTFMLDQFAATGRGDSVYLVGWTQTAPTAEQVGSIGSRAVDDTLYIIELETERQPASGSRTTVHIDQFTWLITADTGATDSNPNNIAFFNEGGLTFRFTPIPSKQLAEVNTLTLVVEETNVSFSNTEISLYDWEAQTYVPVELNGARTDISRPARFIGPFNAVEVQIARVLSSGSLAISRIGVEQTGQQG